MSCTAGIFTPPSISQFKGRFQRAFPYANPGNGATATAVVAAGVITAITLTAGGQLYSEPPVFSVIDTATPGPGGSGCVLNNTLVTVAKGAVTAGPTVTSGGAGYENPVVVITGGGGDPTNLEKVVDNDIQNAFNKAAAFDINQQIIDSQTTYTELFLLLCAHYLIGNLQADMEGLSSKYDWLTTSRSMGDVSESFAFPEWMSRDPMLCDFSKTRFGAMFLSAISPYLVGHTMALPRWTPPT